MRNSIILEHRIERDHLPPQFQPPTTTGNCCNKCLKRAPRLCTLHTAQGRTHKAQAELTVCSERQTTTATAPQEESTRDKAAPPKALPSSTSGQRNSRVTLSPTEVSEALCQLDRGKIIFLPGIW